MCRQGERTGEKTREGVKSGAGLLERMNHGRSFRQNQTH
jgi:hypothetical protein